MKKNLVILLLFMAVNLFSQTINQQQPQQNNMYNDMNYYGNQAAKYRKMKVKGIIRASIGGGMLISGLIFLTNGLSKAAATNNVNSSNPQTVPSHSPLIVGGTILTIVGALIVTGGTLRAIIGAKKEKEMVMSNHHLSVFIAPTAFKIAYTF